MAPMASTLYRWIDETIFDLGRQFRWSYLPPLMVYLAAGVSGLTAIVGAFFIKDYLGLSAAFLAGLGFWAGLPWALKMPLGHLVDIIWRWKAILVYLGAGLIALSILIMYGLIAHTAALAAVMAVEAWFVVSVLLAPIGYVVQDVVADAMTVEAVPTVDADGQAYSEEETKRMHTTMQTLGRFAIISGTVVVAALNIYMFSDVETMSEADKVRVYANVYLMALVIPVISIMGVILGSILLRRRARHLRGQGFDAAVINKMLFAPSEETRPNWWIFGGSAVFVVFTLTIGLSNVPFAQEIIFTGSMGIVLFLMRRLILELDPAARRALVGTAVIIFIFRAVPDLVRNRRAWLRSAVSVGTIADHLGPYSRWHHIAAPVDGDQVDCLRRGLADGRRRHSFATQHRPLLRHTRNHRGPHSRRGRRTLHRRPRHRPRIALGPDRNDPDACLDCQERAAASQGDVLRGHGVVHKLGVVGQQPGDQIRQSGLSGDPRGARPGKRRDDDPGGLFPVGLVVDRGCVVRRRPTACHHLAGATQPAED
jgi:hypothetical protein